MAHKGGDPWGRETDAEAGDSDESGDPDEPGDPDPDTDERPACVPGHVRAPGAPFSVRKDTGVVLRTARVTEALQRSLLPDVLPTVPGWSLDARYEPAGGGYVGGDWFDAVVLPSGRLALVVGDVAGHGPSSAAVMGEFLTALRAALVRTGTAHGAVSALARYAAWTMPDDVATLAVAVLDPSTGEAEHVRLGHPPPLLVTADGRTEWVPATTGLPLGFVKTAPPAETFAIPRGAALVLFSDGLVERRRESIRDGLSRLAQHYEGAPAADVGAVVAAVRDPASADDATILVARRHTEPSAGDEPGGALSLYRTFRCGEG